MENLKLCLILQKKNYFMLRVQQNFASIKDKVYLFVIQDICGAQFIAMVKLAFGDEVNVLLAKGI